MRNQIIITGTFRFPEGDAAAARVLAIGKALRDAGYEVVFAGSEAAAREEDREPGSGFSYQGFDYVAHPAPNAGSLSPVRRLARYFSTGMASLSWLRTRDLSRVRAVIAYHGTSFFLLRLAALCRQQDIELLFDCTEWYKPTSLPGGRLGPVAADNALRMHWVNRRIGQGIVISRYLESYYSTRGCRVLRLPPMIDMSETKWVELDPGPITDRPLRIVYAGTPAQKDLLAQAIRGLPILAADGIEVELHLVGPALADIETCVGHDRALLDAVRNRLFIHGRKPQVDIPAFLAANDLSLLMRPLERFAQAGFSTKLVESLAAGVPVLANSTGDIAEYVSDTCEGVIMAAPTTEDFVAAVHRIVTKLGAELPVMRIQARKRAEEAFDYRGYVRQLAAFIEGANGRAGGTD
jgi:glycosyltransferase involved in cell wall biosynthesis